MKIVKKIFYTFICTSSISIPAFATTDHLFIQAQALNKTDTKLSISTGIDMVNDTVDVFDIRDSEGIKDDAGDYKGFHIKADYQLSPLFNIEAAYWQREIEYSKDKNEIQTPSLALTFSPSNLQTDKSAFDIKISAWSNIADSIKKSGTTKIGDLNASLTDIQVLDIQDTQFQLDGIFSHQIDFMNQINLFGGIGYSKVEVEKIKFQANHEKLGMNGCAANVTVSSDNQYVAVSTPACDKQFTIILEGDARDFGVDIQKDLNYDSYYGILGASWNWRYKQFESQFAYQYQRLWRKDIDDRINQFGTSPIKDNHTFGAKFSYDISPNISAYLQGQLFQHNLIGYIPFLYNGVTAARLDKRYGLASFGIQFKAF